MSYLTLKGFKKVDEDTHPELLQSEVLASLINMTLDYPGKYGIPRKRFGFSKFNANGVTDNKFNSIHDVTDISGNNYLLLGHEGNLSKSLSGTGALSSIKTGLSTDKIRIAGLKNGRYALTNGYDKPFYVAAAAFATVGNLGITKPNTTSMTLAQAPGGNMEAGGVYGFAVQFITDTGDKSSVSNYTSIKLADGYNSVSIANIPVSSDSRVVAKRIFRTKANEIVYYLSLTIPNSQTSIQDSTADTSLDLSVIAETLSMPTKAKYLINHKDRLFFGNVSRSEISLLQNPTINVTANVLLTSSEGVVADGVYYYRFCWVDKNGLESELSTTKVVTVSGGAGSAAVDLSLAPYISDDNIAFYRVYRGKWNLDPLSVPTLYYVTDIPMNLTTVTAGYIDINNQSDLSIVYPKTESVSQFKDYKNAIIFTDIDNISSAPAINFIQVFPDEGDEIVGLVDDQDGILIFKKNSICKLYTSGSPYNWAVKKINETGSDEPESICKVGSSVYFSKSKKIYKYSNGAIEYISKGLQTSFNLVTTFSASAYSAKNNWLIYAVILTATHYLFIYDEKLDTWYKFSISTAYSVTEKRIGSSTGTILIGCLKYLAKYDIAALVDTNSDLTTAISVSLITKTFTFPEGLHEARLRKLWVNYTSVFDDRISNNITHKLYDVETAEQKTLIETIESPNFRRIELITDSMDGELIRSAKFYCEISGSSLNEFSAFILEYRPVRLRQYFNSAGGTNNANISGEISSYAMFIPVGSSRLITSNFDIYKVLVQ